MTLVGEPGPPAPLERQPANAFRRSFAAGFADGSSVTELVESAPDTVDVPRVSRRERRRQRTLRKQRLFALPVAIALLLISFKLLTMSWFSHHGAGAYDGEEYALAKSDFNRLRFVNVVEPWRVWMGIGDARYRMGDLTGAETAFSEALRIEPDRCDVRFNLAVTIEADGDRRMGDDVNEVTETERVDGLARYRVALDVINVGECPIGEPDGAGARLVETRDRLENKLGGEGDQQNRSGTDDPDDGEDVRGEESETASQTDQLQQRNETAAAERQDTSGLNPADQQDPADPDW